MVDIERIRSGVPGLDNIISGGIPKNNLVVVSGDPGSGKTILCMEFIYQGAKTYGENGVFVSLEESKEDIIRLASLFGWDFEALIKQKKMEIVTIDLYDFDQLKDVIEDTIARVGAKRIVIDPGVIFKLYFNKELEARKKILELGKMLKESNCTAIITNEFNNKDGDLFGLEEYVADGAIILFHKKIKERFVRSVEVIKMRGTKISEKTHPVIISKQGVEILYKEEMYE